MTLFASIEEIAVLRLLDVRAAAALDRRLRAVEGTFDDRSHGKFETDLAFVLGCIPS